MRSTECRSTVYYVSHAMFNALFESFCVTYASMIEIVISKLILHFDLIHIIAL